MPFTNMQRRNKGVKWNINNDNLQETWQTKESYKTNVIVTFILRVLGYLSGKGT